MFWKKPKEPKTEEPISEDKKPRCPVCPGKTPVLVGTMYSFMGRVACCMKCGLIFDSVVSTADYKKHID